MSGILDLLNSDLGKQIIQGVSQDTNQPQDKTAAVMSMALPILMGAMKRNAKDPSGAEGLLGALKDKRHDGSILDNLGGLFNGGVDQSVKKDGEGILKHVLGDSEQNVANALAKKSGVSMDSVMNILKVAAPILLGFLGKQSRAQGVQSSSGIGDLLGGMLGGGNQNQGLLEAVLDGNHDGSVLDDIAGMVLGGNKSGGLGSLLGGLFGK